MANQGWWQRVVSVEILGSICVTIFLVGGAWASLGNDVETLANGLKRAEGKAQTNAVRLEEVKESIHAVEKEQAATNKELEGINHRLDKQDEKLDRIYELMLEQ